MPPYEPPHTVTPAALTAVAEIRGPARASGGSRNGEQVSAAVSEQVAMILRACATSPQSKATLLSAAGLAIACLNYKRHI